MPISKEVKAGPTNKLSFNEKREFEMLEKEMPLLEQEKIGLESKLSDANLSYVELQKIGNQILEIIANIEAKEMRWLELSERNG